jgi:hypothetical protein
VSSLKLEHCIGLKMDPIITGGPATEVLTQKSFEQDFGDRVCTIRNYFRESAIYNVWQIRK